MVISIEDIDAELERRKIAGDPLLQDIDEELRRRGVNTEELDQQFPAKEVASEAFNAAEPVTATKQFFETDPAVMQERGGGAFPVVGGALGGFTGASVGELIRQMTGTILNPKTVPESGVGRAAMAIGAGVAQEPKVLKALNEIPGFQQSTEAIANAGSKAISNTGKGIAKVFQVVSGGKAGDFVEATKKGYQTYAAPSVEKASSMFGKALEKVPGENVAPTMAEHIQSAITPESSAGNKFLLDIGKKLDAGELIDARQALKAKQSIDDVLDTVPAWQIKRKAKLFDLKRTFDDVMSSQSGELKDASNSYRAAMLKNNMLKFFRVNKHGEYSAIAPMLSGLASATGATVGGIEGGKKGGIIGGLAPIAYGVLASPASFGAASTTAGAASKAFGQLGSNPAVRQALLQILQKITSSNRGK